VVDLIAAGKIDVLSLVSHVVPAALAADAYALLDTDPSGALQMVLDFRPEAARVEPARRIAEPAPGPLESGPVRSAS
jgi:hypothetical protein